MGQGSSGKTWMVPDWVKREPPAVAVATSSFPPAGFNAVTLGATSWCPVNSQRLIIGTRNGRTRYC